MKSLLLVSLFISQICSGQYYYNLQSNNGNPKGLNNDNETSSASLVGWTSVLGANNSSPTWSSNQSIPFSFSFNGSPVAQYKVSSAGILTFDIGSAINPTYSNHTLPSSVIPNNSICISGIQGSGSNDAIVSKTFGTAPNRQHWVFFSSYSLTGSSNSWSYWSIVLEESSNMIYIVDQRQYQTTGNVSLGIQINNTTAYTVLGSPNVSPLATNDPAPLDNAYYEFIPGTRPNYDVKTKSVNAPTVSFTNNGVTIGADIINFGQTTLTSMDINYNINNGSVVNSNVTSLNLPYGSSYTWTHPTQWTPSSPGVYTIRAWSSNINGNPDQNNLNDTAYFTIYIKDTIPNRITDYVNSLPSSVINKPIATSSDQISIPNDLDFHPFRDELWVVNKGTESTGSPIITIYNPDKASQNSLYRKDGNAKHFMNSTTGIAFGENGNWGNSPGVFDANFGTGTPFTGPSLWSSDSLVFAQPSGGNGSHLDMLHASSRAMGIAHEKDNVYWIFDSYQNDIVRYDFVQDHGPGNSYHDDGIIRRYPELIVDRINLNIPSHLVLNKKTNWLYIVDGGNNRVLKFDITSGTNTGAPTYGPFETLAEYSKYTGTTWSDIVTTGLNQPSGIDVIGNNMIVSDYGTGDIIFYDISGATAIEIGRYYTGNTGVTGVVIGPDGYIWYTNQLTNEVNKIEPSSFASVSEKETINPFVVYPNPSNDGIFNVSNVQDYSFELFNAIGQNIPFTLNNNTLDLSQSNKGVYILKGVSNANEQLSYSKKIIIK